MDARVKPAHDAEFVVARCAQRIQFSNSPCARAHTFPFSRRLWRPSYAGNSTPQTMRGGGAPHGARVVVRDFVDRLAKASTSPRVALRRATGGDFGHQVRASGDRRDALRTTDPAGFPRLHLSRVQRTNKSQSLVVGPDGDPMPPGRDGCEPRAQDAASTRLRGPCPLRPTSSRSAPLQDASRSAPRGQDE